MYEKHLPIMGICYGMQVLTKQLGGKVVPGAKYEYGHAVLHLGDVNSLLFNDLPPSITVWMSHADQIEEMPPNFMALAYTENSPLAGARGASG
ncbi:gamma-glutamyl-gamma-aminobutyrate hydrolase family protein [Chloroflexota bacterium]